MYVPEIELHQCRTLEQAASLMRQHAPDARLMAGGTDLLVDLKCGRAQARHIISIGRIEALRGITVAQEGLRIGALATITELGRCTAAHEGWPVLIDAVRQMAAEQIRNVATVGGNVACAVPCADLPPVFMVLNGHLTVWSPGGERTIAVRDFYLGPRTTVLKTDELLSEVILPCPAPASGAAFERFALREGNGIAVASVAASLALDGDDTIREARIALGAVSPVPKLVDTSSSSLVGQVAGPAVFENAAEQAMSAAEPISDVRASADYRRELIGILTARALQKAHERARQVQP